MLEIICLAAAAAAVFFLLVMAYDNSRFVIRKYHCSDRRIKKDLNVVLLSDLHSKSFGTENQKLIKAIDKLSPDLILIAGDMYTAGKGQETDTAGDLVCQLAKRYPVYYGNGNHEHKTRLSPEVYGRMYKEYAERIGKSGIRHLVNEKAALLEFGVDIYGLELGREYFGKFRSQKMEEGYLERLLGKPRQTSYSILIAHNPDYFKDYAAWGADLVVSGHVHGGLMRLPFLGGVISPAMKLFPEYD
ncbi:MAG: metallophosphoesterase, partial [Lachnospiraceae bacterium]|nr:metallophosphoesterase [Lachnospiraceae bacterium]